MIQTSTNLDDGLTLHEINEIQSFISLVVLVNPWLDGDDKVTTYNVASMMRAFDRFAGKRKRLFLDAAIDAAVAATSLPERLVRAFLTLYSAGAEIFAKKVVEHGQCNDHDEDLVVKTDAGIVVVPVSFFEYELAN